MATVFRQKRTGLATPPTGYELENRYRCIEARHEAVNYNPQQDRSWCLCGRVIRDGRGRALTAYERAEQAAGRPDLVGREARAFLNAVHGQEVAA
jgi:cytochrome c-type biogenesis protein CcmH/NrfG